VFNKKRLFLLVIIIVFSFSSLSLADTLHLKNGKKINGKIIEEGASSISIMVNGIPFKYFRDEVGEVEKDKEPQPSDVLAAKTYRKVHDIPQEKLNLINRLFEVNGARVAVLKMFAEVITRIPKEDRNFYERLLQVPQVMDRIIPIYDKYYSEEELRDLLNFYGSPTGKKVISVTPNVMKDSLQETVKYFEDKVPGFKNRKPNSAR